MQKNAPDNAVLRALIRKQEIEAEMAGIDTFLALCQKFGGSYGPSSLPRKLSKQRTLPAKQLSSGHQKPAS